MSIVLDGTNGISSPNLIGNNAIINGNFGINQRGVSGTVTLAAGAYGHDRWKAGASGCTYTFATSNNVTTITISAGSLLQVIEGANLFSGTYVLSFTGTAQGKIGAGSFGASGITGTVTGGSNLNIEFNTGTVSLVQFEQGTIATPFERTSEDAELARCQRYYCNVDGEYKFDGILGGPSISAGAMWYYPVAMRGAATLAVLVETGVNATAIGGITDKQSSGAFAVWAWTSGTSVISRNKAAIITADAEL
jgi:hypothetical protein